MLVVGIFASSRVLQLEVADLLHHQTARTCDDGFASARCGEVLVSFLRQQRDDFFILKFRCRDITISTQKTDPIFVRWERDIVCRSHDLLQLLRGCRGADGGDLHVVLRRRGRWYGSRCRHIVGRRRTVGPDARLDRRLGRLLLSLLDRGTPGLAGRLELVGERKNLSRIQVDHVTRLEGDTVVRMALAVPEPHLLEYFRHVTLR